MAQEELRKALEAVELPIRDLQLYLDNAHIFKDTAPGLPDMAIRRPPEPVAQAPAVAAPNTYLPSFKMRADDTQAPPPPPDWDRYRTEEISYLAISASALSLFLSLALGCLACTMVTGV